MKKINYLLFAFLFLGILSSCRDDLPQENVRPAYNYYQEIVKPPDDFIIAFDNTSVGQKVAYVTFDSVGVWLIDRIGDARVEVCVFHCRTDEHHLAGFEAIETDRAGCAQQVDRIRADTAADNQFKVAIARGIMPP